MGDWWQGQHRCCPRDLGSGVQETLGRQPWGTCGLRRERLGTLPRTSLPHRTLSRQSVSVMETRTEAFNLRYLGDPRGSLSPPGISFKRSFALCVSVGRGSVRSFHLSGWPPRVGTVHCPLSASCLPSGEAIPWCMSHTAATPHCVSRATWPLHLSLLWEVLASTGEARPVRVGPCSRAGQPGLRN